MRNEEEWTTFTRTGRVSDYLAYAGDRQRMENRGENAVREEGRQREGTCEGNGAFGSNHW